jgi:hypothetical protein
MPAAGALKPWKGGGKWLSALDVRDRTGQEFRTDRPCIELLAPLGYLPTGFGDLEQLARDGRLSELVPIWCPRSFICDSASIPRILWGIYPPWARYNRAAVLHDYLYTVKICSRERADALFREALLACGVSPARAWIMWRAVRLGGGAYWNARSPEDVQAAREHAARNGGSLEVIP